jgi:hypothetical protein
MFSGFHVFLSLAFSAAFFYFTGSGFHVSLPPVFSSSGAVFLELFKKKIKFK